MHKKSRVSGFFYAWVLVLEELIAVNVACPNYINRYTGFFITH